MVEGMKLRELSVDTETASCRRCVPDNNFFVVQQIFINKLGAKCPLEAKEPKHIRSHCSTHRVDQASLALVRRETKLVLRSLSHEHLCIRSPETVVSRRDGTEVRFPSTTCHRHYLNFIGSQAPQDIEIITLSDLLVPV